MRQRFRTARRHSYMPVPALTLGSLADRYWQHNERIYTAGKSLAERRRLIDTFKADLGHLDHAACTPLVLLDWIASKPSWASDSTRRGVVNFVHRIMNWSTQMRLIPANPFRGVAFPDGESRRPTTDEEFLALLRGRPRGARLHAGYKPDHGWQRLLFAIRLSSARPGEIAGLTWDEVDLTTGIIMKQRHKARKKTKKASPIILCQSLWKLLAWLRNRDPDGTGHVFKNQKGTPWNGSSTSTKMQRLRVRAKVSKDATLHGLRHRAGTAGVASGESVKLVSQLLRHSSVKTTEMYYVHLDQEIEALRGVANRISRLRVPPRRVEGSG